MFRSKSFTIWINANYPIFLVWIYLTRTNGENSNSTPRTPSGSSSPLFSSTFSASCIGQLVMRVSGIIGLAKLNRISKRLSFFCFSKKIGFMNWYFFQNCFHFFLQRIPATVHFNHHHYRCSLTFLMLFFMKCLLFW